MVKKLSNYPKITTSIKGRINRYTNKAATL